MAEHDEQTTVAYDTESRFDPQGFVGALLGGAAGKLIGKKIGGSTAKTAASVLGHTVGSFLPFSAEPQATDPSELELQMFLGIAPKVAQMVKNYSIQRQAHAIGKSIGLLEAAPPSVAEAEGPTELELQGFWNVVNKLASSAKTVAAVAKKAGKIGEAVGLLEAGVPEAVAPPTELELQGFLSVVKQIAKNADKVVSVAKTAGKIGQAVGLLEAAPTSGDPRAGEIQPQQFVALLQQAMPALIALAQGQTANSSGTVN